MNPDVTVAMRLVIMDISQYGDYDLLPLPPEYEAEAIGAVVQLFKEQPTPDKLVDPSASEQKGIPITQQRQS